jgi:hypothetical protein
VPDICFFRVDDDMFSEEQRVCTTDQDLSFIEILKYFHGAMSSGSFTIM